MKNEIEATFYTDQMVLKSEKALPKEAMQSKEAIIAFPHSDGQIASFGHALLMSVHSCHVLSETSKRDPPEVHSQVQRSLSYVTLNCLSCTKYRITCHLSLFVLAHLEASVK